MGSDKRGGLLCSKSEPTDTSRETHAQRHTDSSHAALYTHMHTQALLCMSTLSNTDTRLPTEGLVGVVSES